MRLCCLRRNRSNSATSKMLRLPATEVHIDDRDLQWHRRRSDRRINIRTNREQRQAHAQPASVNSLLQTTGYWSHPKRPSTFTPFHRNSQHLLPVRPLEQQHEADGSSSHFAPAQDSHRSQALHAGRRISQHNAAAAIRGASPAPATATIISGLATEMDRKSCSRNSERCNSIPHRDIAVSEADIELDQTPIKNFATASEHLLHSTNEHRPTQLDGMVERVDMDNNSNTPKHKSSSRALSASQPRRVSSAVPSPVSTLRPSQTAETSKSPQTRLGSNGTSIRPTRTDNTHTTIGSQGSEHWYDEYDSKNERGYIYIREEYVDEDAFVARLQSDQPFAIDVINVISNLINNHTSLRGCLEGELSSSSPDVPVITATFRNLARVKSNGTQIRIRGDQARDVVINRSAGAASASNLHHHSSTDVSDDSRLASLLAADSGAAHRGPYRENPSVPRHVPESRVISGLSTLSISTKGSAESFKDSVELDSDNGTILRHSSAAASAVVGLSPDNSSTPSIQEGPSEWGREQNHRLEHIFSHGESRGTRATE